LQRRYLPILILTGILFISALVGYFAPAGIDGPPTRVLLDNKGGKIIFTHATHSAREKQNCASCHHTSGEEQTPLACADCHVKKFDEIFIADHQDSFDEKQCASCHHPKSNINKFSHERHKTEYVEEDCQACHHDTDIEAEPQACSNCHKKEGTKEIISLKDANHTRCADCHEEMYEEGSKGCTNCHSRKKSPAKELDAQPCADCHSEPVDQLVPTTMNAFHSQCMTCHEKQGNGPFGDDACYQCHMK
jgi:predicted CXXCH cytochrome family protein